MRHLKVVLGAVVLVAAVSPGAALGTGSPDCDGPVPDAQPGTVAYAQREQDNDSCGEQRVSDTAGNPAFAAAVAELSARHPGELPPEEDPFRDPDALQGVRFRSQPISFTAATGQRLPGRIFRPCDASCGKRPPGVLAPKPRYPGVIVVHGGSANQEMYLWGTEALAEAGYMVLTFQIPEPDNAESSFHYPDTKDALDYFTSTPGHPTKAGDVNPLWTELDRDHIGLAGHSAGGVAVSRIGQEDPRVSAIVSWDRAQSTPMPANLKLHTPALFVVADFNCQRVPVCVPQPYTSAPDPKGPGNKDEDYQRLAAAGVDTMKIALRAATHLDFTQFPPGTGSRYGAVTTSYYTLAWFNRYLRGAMPGRRALAGGALRRLTAGRFDDSADLHNISGGTFDPLTQQNVPAHIAGQPVRDRLSFHFRSAWSFGHGRVGCEDIRAGCTARLR